MKKLFLLARFIFFVIQPSFSQAPLIKQWDQRFGGDGNDNLSAFQQTTDNGYILGGSSYSGIYGDKTQPNQGPFNTSDFWIVKTDPLGNKQWEKRFGGTNNDELQALQQTKDGGYIAGGFSNSGISGDKTESNRDTSSSVSSPTSDYWIVKIDSAGNKQWDKRFGGLYDDELYSLQQTNDGGYILGGTSYSVSGGDRTQPSWGSADYWIIKIDSLGNKQWDKRFGGTNNDQLYCVKQTSDGGYLLGGFTWSQASGDKTHVNFGASNNCDYWIIKTDSLGNKQWDQNYGGSNNDQLYKIQETNDGGYVLAGYSFSGISGNKTEDNQGLLTTSDFWIVKIDSLGLIQWDKDFGGSAREDEFGNISMTADHGFLIAGTSYSQAGGNKSEDNLGVEQTWLIKTDSLGNQQWDKTIFTSGHDETGLAIQTNDGSYAVANYTNAGTGGYKTQLNRDSTNLTYDYWISKFSDSTLVPELDFIASQESICANTCISFSNLSHYCHSYQWIFNGASTSSSTDENPANICYRFPGTYDVTLISINNNGSDTLILHHYITVHPNPPPFSIAFISDTLSAPLNFASYQWYYYNTAISQATNYFYGATLSGNYTAQVTDSNGCSTRATIENIKAAVEGFQTMGTNVHVFPNPSYGEFIVEFNCQNSFCAKIELFNLLGNRVYHNETKPSAGENKTEISDKNLPDGIYFLKITTDSKMLSEKIVIEK